MVDNRNDIDVVISKFLSGEATPEEAMFLEDWKSESDANLQHYLESERLLGWGEAPEMQEINVSAAWEKIEPQLTEEKPKARIFKLNPAFFRMAASYLILFGLVGAIGYYLMKKPADDILYASTENKRTVYLEDGTDIVIASNSSVVVDAGYGKTNRKLKLTGSAYFTVKHDEAKPLIIEAGEVFIKDLGTKFDVVAVQDTLFVSVDEGIVSMYDKSGSEVTLHAGESAYYLNVSNQLVSIKKAVSKALKFNFRNRKLGEVVKNLNKAYGTEIELENPALENCTITTRFEDENLEMALTVITETLGLKYKPTPKGYLIFGAKCTN